MRSFDHGSHDVLWLPVLKRFSLPEASGVVSPAIELVTGHPMCGPTSSYLHRRSM